MRGLVLAAVVLAAAPAFAEKVHANQPTKLRARAGEHGQVLFEVKEGQAMTVVSKDGRWVKVRFSGYTGFVARSTIDLPDGDDVQRNTRRRPFVDGRSSKRGFGGEAGPDDRVGGDATIKRGGDDDGGDEQPAPKKGGKKPVKSGGGAKKGGGEEDEGGGDEEPKDKGEDIDQRAIAHVSQSTAIHDKASKSSEVAFKAKPTDTLFVEERKGNWTMVSIEEGDIGWVQTDKLDIESGDDGGPAKRRIDVRARGGLTIINQGLRTAGGKNTVPDNYNIGTSAATIDIGGSVLYPYGKDYLIGGELAYQYALAIPGVPYKDPATMVSSTTGFTVHDLDLRLLGGYDLHNKKGMVLFGRLGYRYQSYLVANVTTLTKNTARIPSETFKAPTIGAAIAIPKVTPTIGLNFHLDLAAVGTSVSQTKNLEDGVSPSGSMFCFGGVFLYRWKPQLDIAATYDLNYGSYSFGAPMASSMRNHTGTAVTRTDVYHIVTVGISKAF